MGEGEVEEGDGEEGRLRREMGRRGEREDAKVVDFIKGDLNGGSIAGPIY